MADDGITRRDFLDGIAITAAGLAAAAAAPQLTGAEALASISGDYPPSATGITGQRDAAVRDAMAFDGLPNPRDVHSTKGGPGIHPGRVRAVDDVYIDSIMVNRWNYGYAYELCSTFDPSIFGPVAKQPQVLGRKPFRNVAIANSDSGAFAYTHSAINEAYRAVNELPG